MFSHFLSSERVWVKIKWPIPWIYARTRLWSHLPGGFHEGTMFDLSSLMVTGQFRLCMCCTFTWERLHLNIRYIGIKLFTVTNSRLCEVCTICHEVSIFTLDIGCMCIFLCFFSPLIIKNRNLLIIFVFSESRFLSLADLPNCILAFYFISFFSMILFSFHTPIYATVCTFEG